MASLVKSLSVKGSGTFNDHTDTYLVLNVHFESCGLQLEPCLDLTAPETVCLVMQTLYKSTLNEAFIIRQIVDVVVVCIKEFAATSENVKNSGQTQPKQ